MRKSQLSKLRNLGRVSEGWLNDIGIYTRDELAGFGSVRAYHVLKELAYPVTLNLVYAIEGALMDIHWAALPNELKERLRRECEGVNH